MTFAPAITWAHLLPAGVGFACGPSVPAWLGDLLPRGGDVHVVHGDCAAPPPSADAVVVVNGRLNAAGYGHVRRYAVLPNLAAARWFIPLDRPAVAGAAFGVYSPTRLSARAKRTAARTAARLGLRGWYRDSVTIAQRRVPALERALAEGLDERGELRLALSAGAPEPARNRKASAAVIRLDGLVVGFAKIAGSPLADRLLRQEAATLLALAAVPAVAVPKLLTCGEVDGRYYLVQSPVGGRAAPAKMTDAHERFLSALQHGSDRPAVETEYVRSLVPRMRECAPDLAATAERVVASLAGCLVPRTIVHGDFAPWNLRRQTGGRLAAFDWEYGRTDGLPAVDATHHQLQVGYNMRAWSAADAAAALVGTADAVAMQNAYLVDAIARLAEEGYGPADAMARWHRDVLAIRMNGVAR